VKHGCEALPTSTRIAELGESEAELAKSEAELA